MNNAVGSIIVPPGCNAIVFENSDFTGWNATFPAGAYSGHYHSWVTRGTLSPYLMVQKALATKGKLVSAIKVEIGKLGGPTEEESNAKEDKRLKSEWNNARHKVVQWLNEAKHGTTRRRRGRRSTRRSSKSQNERWESVQSELQHAHEKMKRCTVPEGQSQSVTTNFCKWDCCAPTKFQLLLPPPRAIFSQSPTCAASGQGSVEYLCDIDKQNHTILYWGAPGAQATLPSYGDNSPFPSTTKFESVAIGASHSCGVLHGLPELFCWGANQNGQSTVPDIKLGAQGTQHPSQSPSLKL